MKKRMDAALYLKIHQEQLDKIKADAWREGVSISEYVRKAIARYTDTEAHKLDIAIGIHGDSRTYQCVPQEQEKASV